MDKQLQEKAEQLLDIYNETSRDFRWKNSSGMNNLMALFHVIKGRAYSAERIAIINDYIKDNTGVFSCYRQKAVLFSALLDLNFPDPEQKFNLLLEYEEKLKEQGFRSYTYRPVTAYTLLLSCSQSEVDQRIAKAYRIFTEMRKNHPWLTSGDDYPLAVLLAESKVEISEIMYNIENIYDQLQEAGFSRSNGLQFLSHILNFSSEEDQVKAKRCYELYKFFKDNGQHIYSTYYSSLGLITLLAEKSKEAADKVLELAEYLKKDRRFRWLGRETIFLTAAALVSSQYLENMKKNNEVFQTVAFVTIEALIAAQTAIMLGATCTATAAASSGG